MPHHARSRPLRGCPGGRGLVCYANDPDNRERKNNGAAQPLNINIWQVGNETSYGNATFTKDESIAHTIESAKAMKGRDRSIQLIGWGDGVRGADLWAGDLVKRAGGYIDHVAIHMGMGARRQDTVLRGLRYEGARACMAGIAGALEGCRGPREPVGRHDC